MIAFGDPRVPEPFWDKIEPEPNSGCWLWTAAVKDGGYGITCYPGTKRTVLAHRFLWLRTRGPLAPGLELDHLCRVTCCVNPAHLEPVTHRTNMLRSECFIGERARATHCQRGHPIDGFSVPKGRRFCRICARGHSKAARLKVREKRERACLLGS